MKYDQLLEYQPYSLNSALKHELFFSAIRECFIQQYQYCPEYQKFCNRHNCTPDTFNLYDNIEQIPYLPVAIFKKMRFRSTSQSQIVRVLQSSATSSQIPSSVEIDHITRSRQMKTLTWILSSFLGKERRPYLVLDVDGSKQDSTISARIAAIRGFLMASSSVTYCMNYNSENELQINIPLFVQALEKLQNENTKAVIFGFTYILYIYAASQLKRAGLRFSLPNVTILHIGGWKKLQHQAVSKKIFNDTLHDIFGIPHQQIIDIYGFTEQLGVIYPDLNDGLKRCSLVSEVIVRDPYTLKPVKDGEQGLLEFITPLPHSYPGLAVLVDDIGRVISRQPSQDGKYGTAFEIIGRAKQAEVRGCGDILSERMAQVS